MGIEQMPPQCLLCPNAVEAKTNAESMRSQALQYEADHPEDLEMIDLMYGCAESVEATYEVITESRADLARQFGCRGLDQLNWRCSLEITKENLR